MVAAACCSVCNKDGAVKRCSKCLSRRYCGRECQAKDWATHKHACRGMARENFQRLLIGLCGPTRDPRFWCEEVLGALAEPPHQLPPSTTWQDVGDLKSMIAQHRHTSQPVNEIYFFMTSMFALRARHHGTSESRAAAAREMEQALTDPEGLGISTTFADPGVLSAAVEYGMLLNVMGQHAKAADFSRRVMREVEERGVQRAAILAGVFMRNQVDRLYILGWEALGRKYGTKAALVDVAVEPAIVEAKEVGLRALKVVEDHNLAPLLPDVLKSLALALNCTMDFGRALVVARRGLVPGVCVGSHFYHVSSVAGNCLLRLQRRDEAERVCKTAMERWSASGDPPSEAVLSVFELYGECLLSRGKGQEAVQVYKRAMQIRDTMGREPEWGRQLDYDLARAYEVAGEMGKALEIDRQLMETRVAAGPSCFARIAKSLIAQGRMEEAEELLEQCYLMCFTDMTVGRPVARSQMAVEMTMRPLKMLQEVLAAKGTAQADQRCQFLREQEEEWTRKDEEVNGRALAEARELARKAREERQKAMDEWLAGAGQGSAAFRSKKAKAKKKKDGKGRKKGKKSAGKKEGGSAAATSRQGAEEQQVAGGAAAEPRENGANKDGEEEEEEEEECPICFHPCAAEDEDEDESDPAAVACLLVCGHSFHEGCLELWLTTCQRNASQTTCPMCRAPIARASEEEDLLG